MTPGRVWVWSRWRGAGGFSLGLIADVRRAAHPDAEHREHCPDGGDRRYDDHDSMRIGLIISIGLEVELRRPAGSCEPPCVSRRGGSTLG